MNSQVSSELQQLGEGLPAVSAAQRMLLTAATVFLAFLRKLELYGTFWSGSKIWIRVTWILQVMLRVRMAYNAVWHVSCFFTEGFHSSSKNKATSTLDRYIFE